MKTKYLSAALITSAMALGTAPMMANSADAPQLNFSCKVIEGVPTTLAQAPEGKARPIFHWKGDALAHRSSATPQELCDGVSNKLENYSAEGYDLTKVNFIGTEEFGLPVICANTAPGAGCSKVLVTLHRADNAGIVASDVVDSILDENLQPKVARFNDRGVQSTSYQVDFWSLLGLNLKLLGK